MKLLPLAETRRISILDGDSRPCPDCTGIRTDRPIRSRHRPIHWLECGRLVPSGSVTTPTRVRSPTKMKQASQRVMQSRLSADCQGSQE